MAIVSGSPTPNREFGTKRRRLVIGGGCAVALVAIMVVILLVMKGGEPSPGPLSSPESSSLSIPQVVGVPTAYGLAVAFNQGKTPAVLERISVVNPPAGLKLVETQISGEKRKANITADYVWPSKDYTDLHPVRGFEVPPIATPAGANGAQLVFVFRADRPGRYTFNQVQIDYRVRGEQHRVLLAYGLRICTRLKGQRKKDCPLRGA